MIKYNIYYNGDRINNRPLSKEAIDEMKKQKSIYKRNVNSTDVYEIPINGITIRRCVIV